MNVIAALAEIARMAASLTALAQSITAVSAIIARVQADGRTELTAAEWEQVVSWDDAARKRLADAIEAAE